MFQLVIEIIYQHSIYYLFDMDHLDENSDINEMCSKIHPPGGDP